MAFDLDFYEMAESEIADALTSIRAAITLRKNNPHLDRDATLELVLQTSRHVANAAEHLPPVDEEGEPYGYEKSWRTVLITEGFLPVCARQTNRPVFIKDFSNTFRNTRLKARY